MILTSSREVKGAAAQLRLLQEWLQDNPGRVLDARTGASVGALYQVRKRPAVVELCSRLRRVLHLEPRQVQGYGAPTEVSFKAYSENDAWFGVPRFLGLELFGTPISMGDGIATVRLSLGQTDSVDWSGVSVRAQPRTDKSQPDALRAVWRAWGFKESDWNVLVAKSDQHKALLNFGAPSDNAEHKPAKQLNIAQMLLPGTLPDATPKPPGGGALLCLPCGWGKTITALMLAWAIGQITRAPLLVVVNRISAESLGGQWVSRINTTLPECRVGWMHADRLEIDGCHIVISTVQSLAGADSEKYSADLLSRFSLVIVDEVHIIGAAYFSQALRRLPAAYILGLSATPKRRDGLSRLVLWQCGSIAFKPSKEARLAHSLSCQVFSVLWHGGLRKEIINRRVSPPVVARSTMLKILRKDPERNQLAIRLVNHLLDRKRQVLVFSDCIYHLQMLADSAHARSDQTTVSLYYAGLGLKDRSLVELQELCRLAGIDVYAPKCENSTKRQCRRLTRAQLIDRLLKHREEHPTKPIGPRLVLRTVQMAVQGFDDPALDTLVLLSPLSEPEQAVGRIRRKYLDPETKLEKSQPEVWDLVDTFSVFLKAYENGRLPWYTAEKFGIRQIDVSSLSDLETALKHTT